MALGFIKRIWNSQKLLFTNSCAEDNSEYATSLEGETLVEEDKPIIFYRGCKDKDKVRVVLIFQTATCWPSWKSLYTSLADKDEFEVVVIHAPWENQSNRLKMYNEARLLLITVGIPFIPSTHFSIENFKPHVVFVQTPYEDYLPEEFKLDELLACQCRIAYIPYGIEIGGGITNLNYQFNLDLHKKAWKIFARSSRHLAMYSKYNPAGSSNVVDLGHPRVDSYPDLAGISIDKKFETIPSEKKVVLYNPHFSVKKDGWSTFLEFGNEIINYALGRDDIFLIIRPHPFLFETLVSEGLWSNEEVLQVKNRIKDSNCCMLDESVDYMQSFKVSDFLISDVSSFLLEYAQTNKPVIYLKKECSVNLNDDESFVNKLYVSRNVDELKQYLNKLLRGDDSGKAERLNMLPQYFTKSLHGNGNAIANYILSEVRYGSNVNYRTEGMKSCDLDSSEEYWKAALTSYLGTPEYYDLQETVLTEVYSKFEKVKSALDVGCSDGRYTELLFKVSEEVTAQDISPVLLEKCKENLKNYNVTFDNSNLVDSIICKSYDLVSCLGVTSTIIDNNFFFNFLTKLTSACNSNGLLITKESLSLNDEQLYSSNGYFGKYRNVNEYLNSFTCQGFEIQSQIELARDEDKSLVNKLFIFKKVGVSH